MKYINQLIICLSVALFAVSCDNTLDVAPMATYSGKANMTIAELVSIHTIGSEDSYDTIPAGTIISGIVTTSDEWGNNYKYINIEDETGGIQIKINNTALYNKYKVGQRIFVNCTDLHIGDYRKLPQLGIWANGSMQPIPNAKTYLYIFPDGAPSSYQPTVTYTSIPNANSIPDYQYNKLVRLEGASFVEAGMATFSEPNAATSHDLEMADGTKITLRTSNYAKFASQLLPSGKGNVVGILTRYNNTVQIVISSLNDLTDFTTPQVLQTIFTVNNYSNAFNEGWTQVSATENAWKVLSNTSFNGFYTTASANENWLISPNINLENVSDAVLKFTHRAPQGFNNNEMLCYYTTNYSDDFSSVQWIQIPLSAETGAVSEQNENFAIPENASKSNFRIAFVTKNNNSAWYISKINISGLQ